MPSSEHLPATCQAGGGRLAGPHAGQGICGGTILGAGQALHPAGGCSRQGLGVWRAVSSSNGEGSLVAASSTHVLASLGPNR